MVVQKCAIVVRTKRNQVSRKYGHAYRKRSRRKGEFFKGDYRREWCDRTISINLKILSIGSNPVAITLTIIAFFLFHETNEEKNKT